jgi:hypothetical protein
MRVLVACEFSGTVRNAFAARGHEAVSCDLLPDEYGSSAHVQGDIFELLARNSEWDLMIAHPPCTYLSTSGLHWNVRTAKPRKYKVEPEVRAQLTEDALDFVRRLLEVPIPRLALENPIGCIGTRIRPADQIIQPYQFGHDASKATCLWLKGLPKLTPTSYVEPRTVNGRPRWGNQCDNGQNKLPPTPDRWALRSITYPGIADAMAEQWGNL